MSRARRRTEPAPLMAPMQWPELTNVAATPPRTVTLADGTEVDSRSEAWRAECEARFVLRIPSRAHRHGYLHGVQAKRGQASRDALHDAVMGLWERLRKAG